MALPRGSFPGGCFSSFCRGPGREKGDAEPGHPLQFGCRGARYVPLPPGTLCGGAQKHPRGCQARSHPPHPPSAWVQGVGSGSELRIGGFVPLWRNRMGARRAQKLPTTAPPQQQPGPPPTSCTCVGLRDVGAGPRSRPLRLGHLHLGQGEFQLGLGLQQGKRENEVGEGVPSPLSTQRRAAGGPPPSTPPPGTPPLCHRPPAGRRSRWRR